MNDQRAQIFERAVGGNGYDVRARRHHLAHRGIAELDHRLDQLAVVLLNEAFLGAGGDQRLDILGRGGGLFMAGLFMVRTYQRFE